MRQHLLKGDQLLDKSLNKVTKQVLETRLVNGRFKAHDLERGVDEYMDYDAFRGEVAAGRIEVVRKGMPRVAPEFQMNPQYTQALAQAMGVARAIQERAKTQRISTLQAYQDLKREHAAGATDWTSFPSQAAIYRYIARERNGLPVLFGDVNKGNRTKRRGEPLENLVQDMLDQHLLKPNSRWTIKGITDMVNQKARDEQLLQPRDAVSVKFVRKVLRSLTSDPELDRMDPRNAAAAKSIAKQAIKVSGPFMRVEQDGLHLPWRVTTPHGETTSLYLVHAIDCFTGVPVGWQLVIGSPTVRDSLKCVESILFSKKARFEALGLDYKLDCYGTPSMLVFDNGPETKGERMQKLMHVGIDPKHCRSRNAHGKPYIERLNRSLKEALQTLPGCTRFDGVDGQRNPEELKDLPMSLDELERWIVRWYYEEWVNKPLKRHVRSVFTETRHLGNTPAQRWHEFTEVEGHAVPMPPSVDSWHRAFYEHHSRTLSRKTGITYEGYSFRGDKLPYLIRIHGEEAVTILVDPDDFRRIYVQDGVNGPLIELINRDIDESTPAYSFAQAKAMEREAATSHVTDDAQLSAFRRDLYSRSVQTASRKTKAGTKAVEQARQTAQRSKQYSAFERARDNPIAAATAPSQPENPDALLDVPALPVLNRTTREELK